MALRCAIACTPMASVIVVDAAQHVDRPVADLGVRDGDQEVAVGGWKSFGASFLGGVDLSGDARDGGWGAFGLVSYSKLTGDAKRSPVTSIRGDADQWFLAAGISYTF